MVSIFLYRIIKSMDKILLSRNSNFTTYSITDINFVKNHNIFNNRYTLLINKYFYFIFFFIFIKNLIVSIAYLTFKTAESIFFINNKKNIFSDIFFISHYVENTKKIEKDFYFSNLSYLLNNKNISNTFLYFKQKKFYNKIEENNFFFLNYRVNFYSLLKIYKNIFNEFLRLIIIFLKKKNKNKKIILFLILKLFKISTIKNQIVSYEFQNFLNIFKPKLIIVTFEGHQFERLFFNIAKKNNIKSLGYVSSVFLPFQYGNNRDLKEEFNPDYIAYQSSLIRGMSNNKITTKKIILGNNKLIYPLKNNTNFKTNNILVIPEGLIDEENFMISSCIKNANYLKNYNFIIRLHPLSSFKKILKRLNLKQNIPNNIILSKETFEKDILRCDFALYRGTSAIIYACSNHILPIYFEQENSPYINPLFKIKSSILHIKSLLNLDKKIKNYMKDKDKKTKYIYDYCINYFENFDLNIILNILKHD